MKSHRILKICLKLGFAMLMLFGLMCFLCGWFFSGLILQPGRAAELRASWAKSGADVQLREYVQTNRGERLTIPSEFGYDLSARFIPAAYPTRRTAVLVHGYADRMSNMLPYAFLMRSLGLNVLLYDQRNSGESGGKNLTLGYYEQHDLARVLKKAHERSGRGSKIVVLGVSMGASAALLLAGSGNSDADLIIADSSYSDFIQEALYRLGGDYPAVPAWSRSEVLALSRLFIKLRSGADLAEIAPIHNIATVRTPVLFITTAEDKYVPPQMTRELYKATRSRKVLRLFDKGGHTEAIDLYPFEYRDAVARFLKEIGIED